MRVEIHSIPVGVWLIIIIELMSMQGGGASGSRELPCHFLDSINITDGTPQQDKSIIFDGITFTEDQYAYVLKNESNRTYPRGCLCNLKPCLRLCCPYGSIFERTTDGMSSCRSHEAATQFENEILAEDRNAKNRLVNHHFGYVNDRPCKDLYGIAEYKITDMGNAVFENKTMTHRDYCLLTTLDHETNKPNVKILACYVNADPIEPRFQILPYIMLISVPFLVATILVYICLPELRNLHGKCLLCYLIGLSVGYFCLALVQLNNSDYVPPYICKPVGYLIYFSFMSAFLWLSVISFDLWWIFRTTQGVLVFTEKNRFLLYMLYAWGFSSFSTFVVFIVDSTSSIPYEFQPSIGDPTCFLKKDWISQLLFFYLPLIVICTINLIFFILTALRIRKAQRELRKVTSREESTRHQNKLNTDKDSFTLYLRLFVIMGATWSMEGISFLVSQDSYFFILTDSLNSIQGVLIFTLFVMKRRVLRLIKKRWEDCFGKSTTTGSVVTNSTSATIPPSSMALNHITTTNEK